MFTYFYTAITMNPQQMAEDMKRNSGFIPGVKPGRPTGDYIDRVRRESHSLVLSLSHWSLYYPHLPSWLALSKALPNSLAEHLYWFLLELLLIHSSRSRAICWLDIMMVFWVQVILDLIQEVIYKSYSQRMIYLKTEDEIELMRKANRLVASALSEVAKHVKPGVTTNQLDGR